MTWDLPTSVEIDGKKYKITNKCDYRVVLDVISVFKQEDVEMRYRIMTALSIFYEDLSECKDVNKAIEEMMKIVNNGEEEDITKADEQPIMDWEHDFQLLAPPISRVLGYSVRDSEHYTHWFDFIGAYMEIGECTFSNIITIRSKRKKGEKLEKWEEKFYRENRNMIDLPFNLSPEDEEFLNFDI